MLELIDGMGSWFDVLICEALHDLIKSNNCFISPVLGFKMGGDARVLGAYVVVYELGYQGFTFAQFFFIAAKEFKA